MLLELGVHGLKFHDIAEYVTELGHGLGLHHVKVTCAVEVRSGQVC